ncbi:MAG: hypothetical protein MJE68_08885 [Proteobacteria bacterium]|nr:hypothetical protein [Pseudomonadota bacterium]
MSHRPLHQSPPAPVPSPPTAAHPANNRPKATTPPQMNHRLIHNLRLTSSPPSHPSSDESSPHRYLASHLASSSM